MVVLRTMVRRGGGALPERLWGLCDGDVVGDMVLRGIDVVVVETLLRGVVML